jgi:hypothetical protein
MNDQGAEVRAQSTKLRKTQQENESSQDNLSPIGFAK